MTCPPSCGVRLHAALLIAALLGLGCGNDADDSSSLIPASDASAGSLPGNDAGSGGAGSDASGSTGSTNPGSDAGGAKLDASNEAGGGSNLSDATTQPSEAGSVQPDAGDSTQTDASTGSTDAGGGTQPSQDDLIAAPDGQDGAPGTLAAPTTLSAALKRIGAGHTIYLRGGSYKSATQITIARDNSGSSTQMKGLSAYNGEVPVLDFSSQPYAASGNPRGLQIDGSYWHVTGLTVTGSADNGIYVAGNNNVIERCITHKNRDTGLQLGRSGSSVSMADWPSNNLILNCESYDNYDPPPGSGENADGFAAKLTVGPGNVFRGCVSHHNIDDGWDLYTKGDTGPIGAVTIDQCIAHSNGTLTSGTSNSNGDRNGFKLGGEKIAVGHTVTRSIAFGNGKDGFTWNSNPGAIRLSNTLAFDNAASNYRFGDNSTPTQAVFTNNVSFRSASGGMNDKAVGSDVANSNCFLPNTNGKNLMVSATDFARSLSKPSIVRKPDGSIDFAAFALATGSDLINAGALPQGTLPFDAAGYYKGAPDLGAVEAK